MTLSHQFLELCIESDRNVRSVLEGSDTEILHVEEKKEPQEPKEEIVELFDIEYADSEKVEQDFIVESLEPESSTDSKDPKIEQSSLATIDEPVDNGEEYLEEIIDEEKIEIKDSTKLCMFCTEEFSTTELFQLHLRSHKHNLDNRIFSCSPCDNLIFDTLKELQTHSETHRKMFSCEKCPEKFTLIADFTTHQAQNCGNSKFKCQICYEYFDKRVSSLFSLLFLHLNNLNLFQRKN